MRLGYAVVFFHRTGTIKPFEVRVPDGLLVFGASGLAVDKSHADYARLAELTQTRAQHQRRLFEVEFQGLFPYLYGLRSLAVLLEGFRAASQPGPCVALYLAAAVSDFFLPREAMSEHKMQSRDLAASHGGLTLCLSQTPKLL